MNVTYSDSVRQAGEPYPQLLQATEKLEEVLGESVETVNAHWDRTEDDKGRPLYTLRLRDPFGEVVGALDPVELESTNLIDFRLNRLWGDLLRVQTKKLLQQMAGN